MIFELLQRVEGDADHDENAGPAEVERDIKGAHDEKRNHRDKGKEKRSRQRNSRKHGVKEFCGLFARTYARHETAGFLEIVGNVYGVASGTTSLDYVNFTVALTAGGTAMDMDQMVMSYSDSTGAKLESITEDTAITCANTIGAGKTEWCIAQMINSQGTANDILDPNEQFILAVALPTTTTPNTQFTINMQPAVGAVTSIKRTVPGALQKIQILY